jgi:hypothetical protein
MQAAPVQRAIVTFSRAGSDHDQAGLRSLYSTGNGVVASAAFGVDATAFIPDDLFQHILDKFPKLPPIVLPPLPP